eukprot:6582178-Prymnesium_polylepis.1
MRLRGHGALSYMTVRRVDAIFEEHVQKLLEQEGVKVEASDQLVEIPKAEAAIRIQAHIDSRPARAQESIQADIWRPPSGFRRLDALFLFAGEAVCVWQRRKMGSHPL